MAKGTKVIDNDITEVAEVETPSTTTVVNPSGVVTVIGLGRKHRYKEGKTYQVSQSVADIIIAKQFVKLKK